MMGRSWISSVAALVIASGTLAQQDNTPPPPPPAEGESDREHALERIDTIIESLERRESQMRELRKKIEAGETPAFGDWDQRDRRGFGFDRDERGRDNDGRRRPDGDRPDGPGPDRPSPDDQRRGGPPPDWQPSLDEIQAFLNENAPSLAERFAEAREKDPERLRQMVERIRHRMIELHIASREDPRLGELRHEQFAAGYALQEANFAYMRASRERGQDSPEAIEARAKMESALNRLFDSTIAVNQREIEQLEIKLAELQARLDEKLSNRSEHIAAQLERMEKAATRGGPDRDRSKRRRGQPEGN